MKTQKFVLQTAFLLLLAEKYVFSKPPHIIFMLIDDLGWNDVSFHGSPQIPTPNIDSLAYSGIILNNYYVQPICTPSRGSLMTGKYPIRLGLQHYVISSSQPWGLSPNETILPQYLKQLGYATHGVGKWHLGYFRNEYLPTYRGFDSFFGYWNGKEDYYTHFEEDDANCGLDFHDDIENAWNYTGYYGTEAFTDKAKKIISSHDSSKPLFLYVAHQAVHAGNGYSPLQAPLEYIKKFSHIKDEERRTFAAMTSALDKSVGEIFSALHERNMLENSVIVFSSDNGGAVEGIDKSTGSNWPLRGSKYNMWEGGVRGTSFIWSPLLSKSKGSVSKNLMHISDWLPTLYAAAGGNPEYLGKIDGYNLWTSFYENSSSPREHILHNIDPEWKVESVRKGPYKLLKGSVLNGEFDGWFDKEGKRKRNIPFSDVDLDNMYKIYKCQLEESDVFQIITNTGEKEYSYAINLDKDIGNVGHCISGKNEFKDLRETSMLSIRSSTDLSSLLPDMHYFSPPVEVNCGFKPSNASRNCRPMKGYCLFDVENDPCEYNNLAGRLPDVVHDLKKLLDKYRAESVPIRNKPSDPKADPKYHNYAWVAWMEEESIQKLRHFYDLNK